ncbi:hypothetical protein [Pinirhizobacter soli]|uniref:hypothetical protein n=1 Tax=Pinirhizobacter soli TaxID=2786953 RepID=UPI00202A9FE4|nr:hypothetical protein [Pinirhizobacter soli]
MSLPYRHRHHLLRAVLAGLLLVLLGLNQVTATSSSILSATASAAPAGAQVLDGQQGEALAIQGPLACDGVGDDTPLPSAGHHWQATPCLHSSTGSGHHPLASILLDTDPRPPNA